MKKISLILSLTLLAICSFAGTVEARHCRTNFSVNVGSGPVFLAPTPVVVAPAPVVMQRPVYIDRPVYVERPVYVDRPVVRYVEPAVYDRPGQPLCQRPVCERPVVVYQQPAVEEVAVYQAPVVVREPVIAPPLFSFSWNWFRR